MSSSSPPPLEDASCVEKSLLLRVKSANQTFEDVEVQVSSNQSVGDVKHVIKKTWGPTADGRYLRLICKGRLLAPDSASIRDFCVENGDVLHAVLAAAGVSGGHQAPLALGTTRRYRGTGVDANGFVERSSPGSDDDVMDESDEEEGRERLGFDRLRSVRTCILLHKRRIGCLTTHPPIL